MLWCRHNGLQAGEEGQQTVGWVESSWDAVGGCGSGQGTFLEGHVGVQVGLDGVGGLMPEPERDHREIDAGLQQCHGSGVAQGVRRDVLGGQRGHDARGGGGVLGDEVLDGVATQGPSGSGAEDRVGVFSCAFGDPVTQCGNGSRRQWGDAVLAAFAQAAQVRPGVEVRVLAAQGGQFGDA